MRLLDPQLRQYKLKYLLEALHLEGENSHLADDDVYATCSVARYCHDRGRNVIPLQDKLLRLGQVKEKAEAMRRKILPFYLDTQSRLRSRQTNGSEPLVASELRMLCSRLLDEGIINPVKNIEYVIDYIAKEIAANDSGTDLYSQIAGHVLEISALKESDLYAGGIVAEKIIITTIHKAKGLEFDNVILFDAADDRYPGFFARDDAALMAEDARKFYVALTRAKKRIIITLSAVAYDRHGRLTQRTVTRYMKPVEKFFTARCAGDFVSFLRGYSD